MASLRAALSVAFVALFASPSPAQELLNDAKLGFKLKAPSGFTKVPLQPGEEWIVARWISDRAYFQNDKSGASIDHKPELNVIAFPSDKVKTHVQEEKSGTGEQSHTTIILKNPYKDYRDYLKQTYHDGGFFVAKEDKAEVEGVPAEVLEIKVEKLTFGGPRKIVTWIFKNDDADFAVQFEMVENAWTKLKGEVTSCMRSFRRIPKEGSASAPPPPTPNAGAMSADLSPAQRAARRRDAEKASQEKFTKNLTEGWTAKKYGRVFILSHVDEKYAAKVAENANAVLDYLDANLGYIGPGEYVRAPVIRICKDSDEMRVYDKGGGGGGASVIITSGDFIPRFDFEREITTYKDTNGVGYRWGDSTLSDVCEHWLREHDEEVYQEMPRWLQLGITRAFGMSRAKGGKLEFYNDSSERVAISQQVHSGKLAKLQDLVKMDQEQLWSDRGRWDECAAATRFLLTGPKKAKDALTAYIGAVSKIARKDEEERKKERKNPVGDAKPKTIEEEDAQYKEANTKRRDAAKVHLEEVYAAAFGTWSDGDWKAFQSAYEKSFD